jgi:hypothetical protein
MSYSGNRGFLRFMFLHALGCFGPRFLNRRATIGNADKFIGASA